MKSLFSSIQIIGAREHNLKNISLTIPKNELIVFTGVSGSGKSTLAFSTLYAEGQRCYLESLSSYARQFLDKVNKPDVDKIEGLTPTIAIDQKTTSKNPRSTVGTVTEIYDYLRLLYARIGTQHCHVCDRVISSMSQTDIISEVLKLPPDSKIIILAPIVRDKKGAFNDKLESLRAKGFVRAQINGVITRLDEDITLSKSKKQTIKAVVDRVSLSEDNHTRIAQGVEKALDVSFGEVEIELLDSKKTIHYSLHSACFHCKISFEPLEPHSFSFNSPRGACEECSGLGSKFTIDIAKIIDPSLPLSNGGIKIFSGFNRGYYADMLSAYLKAAKIDSKMTFEDLSQDAQNAFLYGNVIEVVFNWRKQMVKRPWRGVVQVAYEMLKDERDFSSYMSEKKCPSCDGRRLRKESLSVKVAGLGIAEVLDLPIKQSAKFFANQDNFQGLSEQQRFIVQNIFKELQDRLFFLNDVGLGYLTLSRDSRTISGGESQRIRIAGQIGSGLTGVTYVLDEPSIGLHERDTMRLIRTLKNLKAKGNTVIVVEHDRETIKNSDFIVDIGPLAGKGGGEVVFAGKTDGILESSSLTALYLSRKRDIIHRFNRACGKFIELKNININNISEIDVKIPLQNLVCVTGVSGSGKSSLVVQTLLPITQNLLNRAKKPSKIGVQILGIEHLDKSIFLDQSPIGRTPRSNPATYTGVMDHIRDLFAQTKESKLLGFGVSRFSFNVRGGRCEKCQGEGEIKIEMHFLPDVMVKCDECKGARYNPQTLSVKYKGKSISDVLAMSVDEALVFFDRVPRIANTLKTLQDVGLGYIQLGQNATTLSGGEAQRMKIASELCKKSTGKTLYVLDEPTTGLHFLDVDLLVKVLHRLVDLGNSVIVIEHNLDLIKNADYIIDMGPEGGDGGGGIVDCGSVFEIASRHESSGSHTGRFLQKELLESGLN